MSREDSPRVRSLIHSMTKRLRPLCSEWPEDHFNEMVRNLAEITLKYEGRITPNTCDTALSDRVIVQLTRDAAEHLT